MVTLVHELRRLGVATTCIGMGQGAATVVEQI
jgi:acetyl-CoA acetyltransferase